MVKKVLIVDDEPGIRFLLKEVLEKDGYETLLAANGLQAIELIKYELPHLIMLDLNIPGMSGIEILKKLNKATPVIVITGDENEDAIEKVHQLGVISFIKKPFDINDVCTIVKEILK